MRGGDYTNFPQKPKDPLTGLPFAGGLIPAQRISPVAQSIMKDFYSTYAYNGDPNSFVNNAAFTDSFRSDEKRWVLKFDQNIGTKNFAALFLSLYVFNLICLEISSALPVETEFAAMTSDRLHTFHLDAVSRDIVSAAMRDSEKKSKEKLGEQWAALVCANIEAQLRGN